MCTVLLPPGVNPIAVKKYIISYIKNSAQWSYQIVRYTQQHGFKDRDYQTAVYFGNHMKSVRTLKSTERLLSDH